MALTRNFKETVIQRVQNIRHLRRRCRMRPPPMSSQTARLILRDPVNATIGFEQLAALTSKPGKSLHRMLSPTGNPGMDNLTAIFRAVREKLQVSLEAHSVAA